MSLCRTPLQAAAAALLTLLICGCVAPGRPKPGDEVTRPEAELDSHVLYKQNCAGCHGDHGENGPALPMNNPAYLAVAGSTHIRAAIAQGVAGTLMPAFSKAAGGTLTEQQVDALTAGILQEWSRPADFAGVPLPAYASTTAGNAANGQRTFVTACSRCHGADGTGAKATPDGKPPQNGSLPYPIVDGAYLSLTDNQNLRSLILGGRPDEGMPDWRKDIIGTGARPLTSDEVNDIVAWLASKRLTPGGQAAEPTP